MSVPLGAATWILIVAWLGICSVWGGLILAQFKAVRSGLLLVPHPYNNPINPPPWVTVVIPARNEASGLAACLDRVLAQDYPALSVMVVDDRSEDHTAAVAERVARTDPRVSVKRISELPVGWMGKSHALWQATRGVTSDWLLFIDVDCRLDRHAVSTVIDQAHRRDVEFLTLWPRQAPGGFWEHLIIPLCGGIIALWYGTSGIGDIEQGPAFANGQFLLIARQTYERLGGHRAVRSALIEDIPLAERARAMDVRRWTASGRDLVSVRMYDSLGAIVRGWARIYVGALRSGIKIVISIVWLMLGSLLPFVASIFLVTWAIQEVSLGRPIPPICSILGGLCALHMTLMMIASFGFWGLGGCKRAYLILYPLSVVMVACILARSWWWLAVRRKIVWRDTCYAIDQKGGIIP